MSHWVIFLMFKGMSGHKDLPFTFQLDFSHCFVLLHKHHRNRKWLRWLCLHLPRQTKPFTECEIELLFSSNKTILLTCSTEEMRTTPETLSFSGLKPDDSIWKKSSKNAKISRRLITCRDNQAHLWLSMSSTNFTDVSVRVWFCRTETNKQD